VTSPSTTPGKAPRVRRLREGGRSPSRLPSGFDRPAHLTGGSCPCRAKLPNLRHVQRASSLGLPGGPCRWSLLCWHELGFRGDDEPIWAEVVGQTRRILPFVEEFGARLERRRKGHRDRRSSACFGATIAVAGVVGQLK